MTDAYLPRVAAGDRTAMRQCIEHYSRLVWSLALRLSPSKADAEDAVQEIFLSLWQNAARFEPDRSSEATFISVIARRRLIDRLRRSGRSATELGLGKDAPAFELDNVAGTDDTARTAMASVEAQRAAQALNELPDERRAVVAMSVVEGFTQEEISEKTQLPLGTVKSHLRRGLLAVRNALRERASGERSVAP